MTYTPTRGDTLLIPSGSRDHLHIIVTGISSTFTHLLVNCSSIKPGVTYDHACLIEIGDHPFVTGPSYIAYQFGRIEFASDLANRVNANLLQVLDPVNSTLLARIRAGISTSRFCPKKCQRYFIRNEANA